MKRSNGMSEPSAKNMSSKQIAIIRLVDLRGLLHRRDGKPDLVALELAALMQLDVDPGALHGIGILDGHAWMIERKLVDLRARPLCVVEPCGGVLRFDLGRECGSFR